MSYFVYIIQSQRDNSYYIGFTSNIEKRLELHNLGLSKYTKSKIPWHLVYKQEFKSKKQAIIREKELKNMKSRKYIEKLVSEIK